MSEIGNRNGDGVVKPIAIYYEQPNWFAPLFAQMEARAVPWVKVDARYHSYDAASPETEHSLFFNRMSPSAWQRGVGHGVFYTLNYLKHLEDKGMRVVNGYKAFTTETSKALQLSLMERLGLPYPKARVINHPSQTVAAGEEIGYPLILKPNIGGSGAGIKKFSSQGELKAAVDAGRPICPVAVRGARRILRDRTYLPRPGRVTVSACARAMRGRAGATAIRTSRHSISGSVMRLK